MYIGMALLIVGYLVAQSLLVASLKVCTKQQGLQQGAALGGDLDERGRHLSTAETMHLS